MGFLTRWNGRRASWGGESVFAGLVSDVCGRWRMRMGRKVENESSASFCSHRPLLLMAIYPLVQTPQ